MPQRRPVGTLIEINYFPTKDSSHILGREKMRNVNSIFPSYCLFELEILRLSLSIKIGIEKKLKFQGY